jgi:hypothetical protein
MAKVPPFSEMIAATTRSAVHLETRDCYTPDDSAFLEWKAGRPVYAPAGADWYDLVASSPSRLPKCDTTCGNECRSGGPTQERRPLRETVTAMRKIGPIDAELWPVAAELESSMGQ